MSGKRVRLDVALVERGLESSRERARRLIVAGEVTVNGQLVRAPSTLVAAGAALAVGKTLPYVSRGGLKLAHALDRFGIDPTGRACLDAGASTGGFTDVLLQRGAARVYALDVGKGLLAWPLRQDPRVVVMEEANVRYLRLRGDPASQPQPQPQPQSQPQARAQSRARPQAQAQGQAQAQQAAAAAPELPEPVSLATIDVAFISLRLVLPAICSVLAPDGEVVALVKPQFEAGQAEAKRGSGVVRDPAVHRRVLQEVLVAAQDCGLRPAGITASPIRGQAGNVEFLLWATRLPGGELRPGPAIEAALAEAPQAAE